MRKSAEKHVSALHVSVGKHERECWLTYMLSKKNGLFLHEEWRVSYAKCPSVDISNKEICKCM